MTHLRLPKGAEHCWELHLEVPLTVARALTLFLCGTGCGASPCSAPSLSSQPGPLDSETSHKYNDPFRGEGVIYLKL